MTEVSVVIPAYNEEKHIINTLTHIKKVHDEEIVVVDDGSKDKTYELLAEFAKKHKNICIVKHPVNKGKGAAMMTGVKNAKGEIILLIDASSFDPNEIPKLMSKMNGDTDMVVGVRNFLSIPWQRRVSNSFTKLAFIMATGKKINDPLSGFRAIKRKDYLSLGLKENKYCIESEINLKMLLKKKKIREVGISVSYHDAPSSYFPKLSFFTMTYLMKNVLKIWLGLYK